MPKGLRVHSGSRGFARLYPSMIRDISWVHSGAPSGIMVHSGSRGFTLARLGLVGFCCDRVVSLVRAKGSSGSFGFTCVHSDANIGRKSSRVFTRAILKVPGSFGVAWVHSGAVGVGGFSWVRVDSLGSALGLLGFTQSRQAVAGFVGVRLGSLRQA